MSGDVQPRKRKDKRRKKDDEDAGTPPPNPVNPSVEHTTENLTIHVHKEGGTGGHWCAKIIFFVLFSVLVGLVGVIIFEQRGNTDVDTPIASSRWAVMFDGWVDDILPQHDDDPHEGKNASDEGDEHEEEETKQSEEEEDDEHGDHDEEDQETDEDQHSEEVADNDSAEGDAQDDEGIGSEEDEGQEEEEEDEEEANGDEDDDGDDGDDDQQESAEEEAIFQRNAFEANKSPAEDYDDDDDGKFEDKSDEGYDEQDFEEETDENDALDEVDNASEEDNDDAQSGEEDAEEATGQEEGEEDDDGKNSSDNDLDVSIEGVSDDRNDRDEDDVSQEFFSIPGVGEIDNDSAEPLEEIEDGELEEVVNDPEIEPDEEVIEEESTSVAVKFGVGVALIVAAHFVLVRRWNNVETELAGSCSDEVIDLSRRNTIVPPVNPKDLADSTDDAPEVLRVEKLVESYEELRVKYKGLEIEGPEVITSKKSLGKFETSQLKNISGQRQPFPEDKRALVRSDATVSERETEEEMQTSESDRFSATEPEEDDEIVSEEAEEEEEEDEDDEDEEDEDEDEVDDADDNELVAKLEAKYGKLPTPTESEEEDDDDEDYEEEETEEDDEDDAEEEDEEIRGWKRVKAPKGLSSESEGVKEQQRQQVAKKKEAAKGGHGGSSTGGQQADDYVNDSSADEVSIQEEINNWLSKELDN